MMRIKVILTYPTADVPVNNQHNMNGFIFASFGENCPFHDSFSPYNISMLQNGTLKDDKKMSTKILFLQFSLFRPYTNPVIVRFWRTVMCILLPCRTKEEDVGKKRLKFPFPSAIMHFNAGFVYR